MTNAELTREVCRMIRRVHDNYPQGFGWIVEQVEALQPAKLEIVSQGPATAGEDAHVYAAPRSWQTFRVNEDGIARQDSQPKPLTTPEQPRRKRGRPKGSKNKPKPGESQ